MCHEQWTYDEDAGVAVLRRLTVICRPCNGVHHFGQAAAGGWLPEVLEHLESINGIDRATANEVLRKAMAHWRSQSKRAWTIQVDPRVLLRFPELACLNGLEGQPGDGKRRLTTARRTGGSKQA